MVASKGPEQSNQRLIALTIPHRAALSIIQHDRAETDHASFSPCYLPASSLPPSAPLCYRQLRERHREHFLLLSRLPHSR